MLLVGSLFNYKYLNFLWNKIGKCVKMCKRKEGKTRKNCVKIQYTTQYIHNILEIIKL